MGEEVVAVLSEMVLPMAERLTREQLVLPGAAGKQPFDAFDPAETSRPRSGFAIAEKQVGTYAGHPNMVEWVFGLSGRAEMALDGGRYEVAAGELVVIPPRVPHLERILHQDQGFHLIWICGYLHQANIKIHASSYNGGSRFQLVRGACLNNRADLCRNFARTGEEAALRGKGWLSLLRASVVEALVDIVRHLEKHGLGQSQVEHRASMVDLAKQYIHSHYSQPLALKQIAAAVFLSPNYFSTLFAQSAGMTVFDYVQQVRLEEAQRQLSNSLLSINDVARNVGFLSRSHFTRSFRQHCGCSPREFRRRKIVAAHA